MNKEEILARNRRDKAEFDEREMQIYLKACQLSRLPVIVISALYALVDLALHNSIVGFLLFQAILFGIHSIEFLVVGCRLKKIAYLVVTIAADDLGIVSAVCNIIYSGMFATECWICAVKLKNKKMYWFTAIIFTVFFVFFSIFFVQDLIAWTTN